MSIATRLGHLKATIDKARQNAPLASEKAVLLGACKGQSQAIIEEAIENGLTVFGENRVQEAYSKWPQLKKRYPGVTLHLIGALQSNKVEEALALFDAIQTLDRPKLAEELAKQLQSSGKKIQLYIQVNTGKEPQKAGVTPEEADAFIDECIKRLALPIVGLMCVPPADQPATPHFAMLREIAQRHGLKELSMGMSGDFENAVRMGSSCVRIGTALFGERA